MRPFGTTIFAEMSALAVRTGAVNLGQGFPDTDGPAGDARRRRRGASTAGGTSTRRARASRRCARAIARAPAAVLGPRLRPGRRGPGHRRRDRGDRGGDPRAVRARRRGGLLRALLRLVRRLDRAGRRGAPAGDAAPARRTAGTRFDPDELRARVRPAYPAGAAQLAAQPDRQGLHPRGAGPGRASCARSTTCTRSPTRSTSTWSFTTPRAARAAGDPARHARADAADLVGGQDVLLHRLEDRLGERPGAAGVGGAAGQAVPDVRQRGRRSSRRSRSRSACPTPTSTGSAPACRPARPAVRRPDRRRVRGARAGGHVLRHRRHHAARRHRRRRVLPGAAGARAAWWPCRPRCSTTTRTPGGGWSGSRSASGRRCSTRR